MDVTGAGGVGRLFFLWAAKTFGRPVSVSSTVGFAGGINGGIAFSFGTKRPARPAPSDDLLTKGFSQIIGFEVIAVRALSPVLGFLRV